MTKSERKTKQAQKKVRSHKEVIDWLKSLKTSPERNQAISDYKEAIKNINTPGGIIQVTMDKEKYLKYLEL